MTSALPSALRWQQLTSALLESMGLDEQRARPRKIQLYKGKRVRIRKLAGKQESCRCHFRFL